MTMTDAAAAAAAPVQKIRQAMMVMQVGGGRPDGTRRWSTLSHNGVEFSPPYRPHHAPVLWRSNILGRRGGAAAIAVTLPPAAEEAVTEFVRRGGVIVDGRAMLFGRRRPAINFWQDWSGMLPPGCPIRSLDGCELNLIAAALLKREAAATKTFARRGVVTSSNCRTAIVDGKVTAISPFAVDRPGIFVSKGSDGKNLTGRYRRRLTAADITLNIGEGVAAPPASGGGAASWGAIVHDPFVDWVARWRDPITARIKYARLSPEAVLEQKAELQKYELARRMWQMTPALRHQIANALLSSSPRRQQLGVCMWLVDKYALRIGAGSVQDAVQQGAHGATTLLVRHASVRGNGPPWTLSIAFPGKDGIPFETTLQHAPEAVASVLRRCIEGRRATDPLLPLVSADAVNRTLSKLVPGATAKVLRTARASALFEETIAECEATFITSSSINASDAVMAAAYRLALLIASARVSILCNHRRRKRHGDGINGEGDGNGNGNGTGGHRWVRIDQSSRALNAVLASAKQRGALNLTDLRELARSLRYDVIDPSMLNLSTARANYIDPRIVHAMSVRSEGLLPIRKVYSRAIDARFSWAARTSAAFQWRSVSHSSSKGRLQHRRRRWL